MSNQTQTDLRQLTETVNRLSEALAASERRHSAMARTIRWVSISVVVMVTGVSYVASDWITAYASQMPTWNQIEAGISSEPPAIDSILQSLGATKEMQGALVKVMQSAASIAAIETNSYLACNSLPEEERKDRLCYSQTGVRDLGEFFLDENGELPVQPGPNASQQERMAYGKRLMEATLMATGQSIVDAGVLLHRLRRDSDLARQTVDSLGGVEVLMQGINSELAQLNLLMKAIPAMANEMHVMNRQITVMSHGVGSTMGRMGNILPW